MFKRERHQQILSVLQAMNGTVLAMNRCYFGGGTAIAMTLDEYRESVDIDFLVSSAEGYRALRSQVFDGGIGTLFRTPPAVGRDPVIDQYGIRTVIMAGDTRIKFEIVSEGRIALTGERHSAWGVPVLSRQDMFATKLLANSDRYGDRAVLSRDIIDLAMLIDAYGPVPDAAWEKARQAYGDSVDKAFERAVAMVSDRRYLDRCLAGMKMAPQAGERIARALGVKFREQDMDDDPEPSLGPR